MNTQEVFNTVARHLLSQGSKSLGTDDGWQICAYRGEDGTKCAIGVLIKDEYYNERLEGESIENVAVRKAVRLSLGCSRMSVEDYDFLGNLQSIHDLEGVRVWRRLLNKFAADHKLEFPTDLLAVAV